MATDATGPLEAIARSGTMAYSVRVIGWLYSIDGISPRSIAPSCSNSAHFEGTSNRRSNCGEVSRPYTSGRALRYPTAPRRTRGITESGRSGHRVRWDPGRLLECSVEFLRPA